MVHRHGHEAQPVEPQLLRPRRRRIPGPRLRPENRFFGKGSPATGGPFLFGPDTVQVGLSWRIQWLKRRPKRKAPRAPRRNPTMLARPFARWAATSAVRS